MNAVRRPRIRPPSTNGSAGLLGSSSRLPEGFRYQADLLTPEQEESLARELAALPFKPFDFHGYQANRQVVGFGFRYDYGSRQVVEAPPLPPFLEPLRQKIAEAFDRPAKAFRQVLVNEYRPGAGIGWHRDGA
jgi:alkylated DNA repair dioxygenase AlkB